MKSTITAKFIVLEKFLLYGTNDSLITSGFVISVKFSYCIAGKFGEGKVCEFTLFKHLAKESLAN